MTAPKAAIEPLSLREVAFEDFEAFFESIIEQAQFTPEQQLSLGEQLKAGIEKRDKLGNCIHWIDGQADLLRDKEKQLADRRRNLEKFSEAIKSSLHQQMLDWSVRKVEGNEYTFAIKRNPPKVIITDEAAIPPEYIGYQPVVDKAAIKIAIEDGIQVPGAELTQSTRIEIK